MNETTDLDAGTPAAAAAPTDGDQPSPDEAASAAEQIAFLQAQVADLKNEVLRARADTENLRKRAERDVEAAHKYGAERLLQDLLPLRDSLELGLDAASSATDLDSLRQGMALTAKLLADFFDKIHVRRIDPVGERFDPEFHQAMTMEVAPGVPAGTVLRVMQCGYALHERLLRPALVVVARAADDAA